MSLPAPVVTSPEHLVEQLQHPAAETIWNRAVEIFGDEVKAKDWMTAGREIFDGVRPNNWFRRWIHRNYGVY